jgi:hypothetical protein
LKQQNLTKEQYEQIQDDGEGRIVRLDNAKLIIATYHVLFCNETAVQNVYEFVDKIRKTALYHGVIKKQVNAVEKWAKAYSRKVNTSFLLGKHSGREPENITMFADMNDYMDEITQPVIKNTQLAIRLALSQGADNAVADGQMKSNNFDEDTLSRVILSADLCHIATEVLKAERLHANNLCGGAIHNMERYNLVQLEGGLKILTRLICEEMRIDGIKISSDPNISAWIKDLCKKLCSIQNIINALKTHDENVLSMQRDTPRVVVSAKQATSYQWP